MSTTTGTLFIIAAPSGAGKTSLVQALVSSTPDIKVSISHTTRPPRPNEINGENYHFVDKDIFLSMQERDEFLESAEVFGHYYGTSKEWVEKQLMNAQDVILEIDWQGADIVRKKMPQCKSIFILPPEREILEQRLRHRAQDDEAVIAKRMQAAISEMSHYDEFDYLIVNDHFEIAKTELQHIILAERYRIDKQQIKNERLLRELLQK